MLRRFILVLVLAAPTLPLSVSEVIEQGVLRLVNLERSKRQLPSLRADPALTAAARGHSQNMCKYDFFDHTSPVAGEAEMEDRIARAGGRFGTNEENLYWCRGLSFPKVPRSVLSEWMESPDHKAAVLNPESHFVGVGCYQKGTQVWVTADFSDV